MGISPFPIKHGDKNTMIITLISTVLVAGISSFIIWKIFNKKVKLLQEEVKGYEFKLKSAYVKFGKSFEHFIPFSKQFPGDREKTIFLGMPIDFISFDEDSIKFIEVKTGLSQLSSKQKSIKKLIDEGKVEFRELRY